MAPKERLKVIIIGGGLSGLLAARVLREHHDVIVLERSKGHNQIGAAVGIGETGVEVLERFGLDRYRAQAVVNTGTRIYDMNHNLIGTHSPKPSAQRSKSDYLLFHRVDLWEELYRLATADSASLGIDGDPACVRFGIEVVDVDVLSGKVVTGDGETIESDLTIGADGISSVCRTLVVQQDDMRRAHPAGTSAFRFLLPADEVRRIHPGIGILDKTRTDSIDVCIDTHGTQRSVVMYAVRDYNLVNFVCIVPNAMVPRETTASWAADGTTDDLLRCFEDWGPFVKDMLIHASGIRLWQFRDHDPLPTYARGRTLLIGDSAHAMTPHQAQGATQAFEDVEALDLFNDPSVDRLAVPGILQQIDRVRRPRASRIQLNSRAAQSRKSAEDIAHHEAYNATYHGIRECLRRLDRGEEMIVV